MRVVDIDAYLVFTNDSYDTMSSLENISPPEIIRNFIYENDALIWVKISDEHTIEKLGI